MALLSARVAALSLGAPVPGSIFTLRPCIPPTAKTHPRAPARGGGRVRIHLVLAKRLSCLLSQKGLTEWRVGGAFCFPVLQKSGRAGELDPGLRHIGDGQGQDSGQQSAPWGGEAPQLLGHKPG